MIKVLNSRGRILLEVTEVVEDATHGRLYTFKGEGCGGLLPRSGLESLIACIKLDAPSAHVVGNFD